MVDRSTLNGTFETVINGEFGTVEVHRANFRSQLLATQGAGKAEFFFFDHLERALDFAGIQPHEIPKPRLRAIASSPRNGVWQVRLRYLGLLDREQHDMPAFDIPAENYEHAKNVVDAFNSKA